MITAALARAAQCFSVFVGSPRYASIGPIQSPRSTLDPPSSRKAVSFAPTRVADCWETTGCVLKQLVGALATREEVVGCGAMATSEAERAAANAPCVHGTRSTIRSNGPSDPEGPLITTRRAPVRSLSDREGLVRFGSSMSPWPASQSRRYAEGHEPRNCLGGRTGRARCSLGRRSPGAV